MVNIKRFFRQNRFTLILLLVAMILTVFHGFFIGITIENDPKLLSGDFYFVTKILVLNIAFVLFSIIFAIINLFTKPYTIGKTIILSALLIMAIFIVPVCSERMTGGVTGASSYSDKNAVQLITEGPYDRRKGLHL